MLISSKGMYGIRAVFEIANMSQSEPIAVSKISALTGISQNYLEQLLGKLAKAKILKVQRGVNGGYNLAKDPKDITINEILSILEGKLRIANRDNSQILNIFVDDLQASIYKQLDISIYEFKKYKERFESSLHFSI